MVLFDESSDAYGGFEDLRLFLLMVGLAEFFGLLSVILLCVLMSSYYHGFSYGNLNTKFNLHPLLMTFAMIFLYGNGILLYRVFRRIQKYRLKMAHAILQLFVFLLAIIAVKIAWDVHEEKKAEALANEKPEPTTPDPILVRPRRHGDMDEGSENRVHLTSLHTWLGLATVILFGLQLIFGCVSFLYPQLRLVVRQAYMPLHVFWGAAIFVLAAATALTGITEYVGSDARKFADEPQGYLVNFFGISVVCYVITVLYTVTRPAYKRRPLPEERAEREDRINLTDAGSSLD